MSSSIKARTVVMDVSLREAREQLGPLMGDQAIVEINDERHRGETLMSLIYKICKI